MGWERGQEIIDRLRFKKRTYGHSVSAKHAIYGKIYYPNYNLDLEFLNQDSNLYNEYGEKLKLFFIRDNVFAHNTFRYTRHFIWDRYNFTLDTHFYTHKRCLETMGNPKHRYAMFIESEAIMPGSYKLFEKYKGLEKDFDLIFTHSAKLLDTLDNARHVPFWSHPWYGRKLGGGELRDDAYLYKTKDISILSSNKLMSEYNKFRVATAMRCKRDKLADTFGTFDGGPMVKVADTLKDYRFSICIENDIKPYFFTEKLTNAFAAQTVPIYLGATEIDKFFNPDGIIKFTKNDDIEKVLKQCTKEEYESRLPAILDNYKRVLKYKNEFDYMYETYLADKL